MIDAEDRERLEKASRVLHNLWDTVYDYRVLDRIHEAMVEVDEVLKVQEKYSRDTW